MGYHRRVSYVGYVPLIKQYIHQYVPLDRPPAILEVGIDRGTSLIPIVVFLARTRAAFAVVGVDVKVQESLTLVLANLDLQQGQDTMCVQANSLEVLPKLVERGAKFDVIMIDGDHNYHTVSHELEHVASLAHPQTLIVIDDYDGRWAERDLWYAERDGYADVTDVTRPVDTTKHGVRPAVDEWLERHPEWQKSQPIKGEAIMLMRKSV